MPITNDFCYFQSYIIALYAYVLSFTKKTQPLVDVAGQQLVAETEFVKLWADDKIEGWSEASKGDVKQEQNGESSGIWCNACAAGSVSSRLNHEVSSPL